MKALVVTALPCEVVRELGPESYVGYRIGDCSIVEHLLLAKGRVIRARRKCSECVLGQLVRHGHLVAAPSMTSEGLMRFIVSENRDVIKVLKQYNDQVVSIEKIDLRSIPLSPRQREAIALLADGAGNISGVARTLGISKTAAWKLIKKSIRKIARVYA